MTSVFGPRQRTALQLHRLTYKNQARKLLHQRTIEGLLVIVLASYTTALVSQLLTVGVFGLFRSLFSIFTILLTAVYFILGALLLGLRNYLVSVNPQISTSILNDLKNIARTLDAWPLLVFYTFSSLFLNVLINGQASTGTKNYNDLVVYISHKGLVQINERYIMTRVFGAVLGLFYGLWRLFNQKDWLAFSPVQLRVSTAIFSRLRQIFSTTVTGSFVIVGGLWFTYNIFLSRVLVRMAMSVVSEEILNQTSKYGPRWYHLGLFLRFVFNTIVIRSYFEAINALSDFVLTKSLNVAATSIDPNACLISGLKGSASLSRTDQFLRLHAFQELAHAARYDPQRRLDIFTDAQSQPTAWKQISDECVAVLKQAKSRFDQLAGRGRSSASSAATATATAALAASSTASLLRDSDVTVRRRLPPGQGGALEMNIFKPSKKTSFFDTLKGKSTEEILEGQQTKAGVEANVEKMPGLAVQHPEIAAFRWISARLGALFLRHPVLHAVLKKFPDTRTLEDAEDFQLNIWAFQALAHLVRASFSEDQVGVVQRDISVVLEAMLELLLSVEAYLLRERALCGEHGDESLELSAHGRVHALTEALRTAIYQIVDVFQWQLDEFKLSSKSSERLRYFLLYQD
ncbi:Nucleoporin NDC1 [Actinomortierella ambigua]|uniref:Nucleoporin NDC1 n=1 Tax=Actinomortierella ambigua TaxID=1343610 RepID=A0A9P6Q1V3_9FUNG|nr:Nucleoporin NDC1 [Actinomortierella ambigua]